MKLIGAGIFIGVVGTIVMDIGNILFSRVGLITRIDMKLLGRMAGGWLRGRFVYGHPDEMTPVAREMFLGVVTHYGIGIGLACIFVLGWSLLTPSPLSVMWTLVYGIGTTVASHFLVYPSMGLGVFGLNAPDGFRNMYSSLANHLFFGIGMALAVRLLN